MRSGQPVQRLRITYGIDGALMYASVLDMGRLWERLLRRARAPLVYSQGFNPHPRLQFASPLPVGYSSACEILDIWVTEPLDAAMAQGLLSAQAPAGLTIARVDEVSLDEPSPQAQMRLASYRVGLRSSSSAADVRAALDRLLGSSELPRQRMKKGQMTAYDLRPLIERLVFVGGQDGWYDIDMLLGAGAAGSGRPEEVVGALGIEVSDVSIRRTALLWGEAEGS